MSARLRRVDLALVGVLALAFGLRLWSIDHGLPFVYNADEELHFVPRAVAMATCLPAAGRPGGRPGSTAARRG